jgi:hypothetical protein
LYLHQLAHDRVDRIWRVAICRILASAAREADAARIAVACQAVVPPVVALIDPLADKIAVACQTVVAVVGKPWLIVVLELYHVDRLLWLWDFCPISDSVMPEVLVKKLDAADRIALATIA